MKLKSIPHASVICTECDAPFIVYLDDPQSICEKCRNKSQVANCNTSEEDAIEFEKWINSLGGTNRVANVMGVDRTTIWRHMTSGKIPKVWFRFMKMSQELAEYKEKFGKINAQR